jgi:hypothetical protein
VTFLVAGAEDWFDQVLPSVRAQACFLRLMETEISQAEVVLLEDELYLLRHREWARNITEEIEKKLLKDRQWIAVQKEYFHESLRHATGRYNTDPVLPVSIVRQIELDEIAEGKKHGQQQGEAELGKAREPEGQYEGAHNDTSAAKEQDEAQQGDEDKEQDEEVQGEARSTLAVQRGEDKVQQEGSQLPTPRSGPGQGFTICKLCQQRFASRQGKTHVC